MPQRVLTVLFVLIVTSAVGAIICDIFGLADVEREHYVAIGVIVGVSAILLVLAYGKEAPLVLSIAATIMLAVVAIDPVRITALAFNRDTLSLKEAVDGKEPSTPDLPAIPIIASCEDGSNSTSASTEKNITSISDISGRVEEVLNFALVPVSGDGPFRILACYSFTLDKPEILELQVFNRESNGSADPYIDLKHRGLGEALFRDVIAEDDGGRHGTGAAYMGGLPPGEYILEVGIWSISTRKAETIITQIINRSPPKNTPVLISADGVKRLEIQEENDVGWLGLRVDKAKLNDQCLRVVATSPEGLSIDPMLVLYPAENSNNTYTLASARPSLIHDDISLNDLRAFLEINKRLIENIESDRFLVLARIVGHRGRNYTGAINVTAGYAKLEDGICPQPEM